MELYPLNIRASNWLPYDISRPSAGYRLRGTEDRVIVIIVAPHVCFMKHIHF